MTPCPGRELLERLLAEQLAQPERAAVEAHVEGCAACQLALDQMSGSLAGPRGGQRSRHPLGTTLLRRLEAIPGPLVGLGPADALPGATTNPDGAALAVTAEGWPQPAGYEVLGELGRGGMGVVYKARHVALGREVALKLLLAGAYATPEERDRLRREAEAVARLQHPNVVQVFEVGEHDGRPFLSLEYVAGGSLAEKLRGSPLPAIDAARLVQTLARAVQAAHDVRIVHRDLKPANVLLAACSLAASDAKPQAAFTPKITDFGLAKRLDGTAAPTLSGVIVGTPSYMAPEQAGGRSTEVDRPADIWALGAILYECLTGRPPFLAETPLDTLLQVVHQEPVPVRQLQPRTPRDLETVCLKCLSKDPRRRYASAADLAGDLDRFLEGRPVRARPVGPAGRLARWCGRNPVTAGLLALVATSLLAGTAVSWYFERQAAADARAASEAKERAEEHLETAKAETKRANFEKERARGHLYVALMQPVPRHWEDGEIDRVLDILKRQEPGPDETDWRGWEWHYQWRLAHGPLRAFKGHTRGILCLAYSPDGRLLAAGGGDGTVRVWDVVTGRLLHTLEGHRAWVRGIAFSPDGRRLFSISSQTFGMAGVGSLPEKDPNYGTVKVWDAVAGRELHSWRTAPVHRIAVHPDGRRLAVAGRGTVRLLDANSGKEAGGLQAFVGDAPPLAFSPDGMLLATAGTNGALSLWDLARREEFPIEKDDAPSVESVAFSPDGRRLVSGGGKEDKPGTVRLWDVADPKNPKELSARQGHARPVKGVAFSPDGQRLASIGADGLARLWDADTGFELRSFRHADRTVVDADRADEGGVAFSPDGQRLATACGGMLDPGAVVKLWDVTGGEEMRTVGGHVSMEHIVRGATRAFGPDGNLLVTVDGQGRVRVWDVAGNRLVSTLQGATSGQDTVISPDGRRVAIIEHHGGVVRAWDVASGQEVCRLQARALPVHRAAFSPDGRLLALTSGQGRRVARSSEKEGAVTVLDVATGRELFTLRRATPGAAYAVAFSPDGDKLAVGWGRYNQKEQSDTGGEVRVWDARDGRELLALKAHKREAVCVAFSPDGKLLASAGRDGTLKVWNAADGKEVSTPPAHNGGVLDLVFSPDGRRLAAACGANTEGTAVKVWDVASGSELRALKARAVRVAFSSDGGRLLAVSGGAAVMVWDGRPLTPEAEAEREALGLLDFLFEKLLWRDDVAEAVRGHKAIAEEVRRKALALAQEYPEDEQRFHAAALAIGSRKDAPAERVRERLRLAEAACRLAPDYPPYLATLGAARYRAGQYQEAAEALARAQHARPRSEVRPADHAFLAMSLHQLGQKEKARAALAQLRKLKNPSWQKDGEEATLLKEAEELLGPP